MMNKILSKSGSLLARQGVSFRHKASSQHLSYFSPHFASTLLKRESLWSSTSILTTSKRNVQLYVPDPKHGYGGEDNRSTKDQIVDGLKQLKVEVKMWRDEWKERLLSDPVLFYPPGETDVMWSFGDNDVDITKFIVSSDSDHNEGKSRSTFEKSPAGYAVFSGHLDSTVPDEGTMKRSGYCNIKSIRHKISFQRNAYFDWSPYNTVVLRVRGDGRPYMINLTCDGYFDVNWMDMFSYVLYTRGGPHWQTTRIPFSKFILSVRGRVQDKQCPLPRNSVSSLGITAASRNLMDGDFSLEIDYIGLEWDPINEEEFAYEMYRLESPYIAGT